MTRLVGSCGKRLWALSDRAARIGIICSFEAVEFLLVSQPPQAGAIATSLYSEFTMAMSAKTRVLLLLDNLNETDFLGLPRQVGLKTAILAREMGAIEWTGPGHPEWTFRLTPVGVKLRKLLQSDARTQRR